MTNAQPFIKKHWYIHTLVCVAMAVIYNYWYIQQRVDMSESKAVVFFVGTVFANITFAFGYLFPIFRYLFKKNRALLED